MHHTVECLVIDGFVIDGFAVKILQLNRVAPPFYLLNALSFSAYLTGVDLLSRLF